MAATVESWSKENDEKAQSGQLSQQTMLPVDAEFEQGTLPAQNNLISFHHVPGGWLERNDER